MNSKIQKKFLLGAMLGLAALPLPAAEFDKTIGEDDVYDKQQNDVTSGTVVVDGTWAPADGKRALANTKEETDAYGLIDVSVSASGTITATNADVFKFSDFSGGQTTAGETFFKLNNAGTIETVGDDGGRVFQFSDTDKGAVVNGVAEITNAGTLSAVDDVLKAAGQIIFTNESAGTAHSETGQVIDLGDVNSAAVGTITNRGVMTSSANEVISGPANMIIENSGRIETTDAGASSAIKVKVADDGVNVETAASARLVLTNAATGEIIGTKHGVTGDRESSITNEGTIIGKGGSGINWDGDCADSPDGGTSFYGENYFVLTVENEAGAVISGIGDGTSLDGDGVDADYGLDLTNAGTISATDSPVSADGLAIGGGIVRNLETGKITASNQYGAAYGILADDSNEGAAFRAVVIENAGTIETTSGQGAAIKIVGGESNVITNSGKILSASGTAIILGDGGDTIILNGGEIEGAIVGGAGTDTLVVDLGAGNSFSARGNVSSMEILEIRSGTFVVSDAVSGIETLKFTADENGEFGKIQISGEGAGLGFAENAVLEFCVADDAGLQALFDENLLAFIPAEEADALELRVFVGGTDVSAQWTIANGVITAIPEPSAFGLLAGTLALAFAVARRRRK